MGTLSKAASLVDPHDRRRGLLVLLLAMGMAMLETVGVASVIPLLAVLGDPEMIESNSSLSWLFIQSQRYGITTVDGFLLVLGVGAFSAIIVSAVYRTFTFYVMHFFIEMLRHSLSSRLLETYLCHPYDFFLDRHSGDLSQAILSEVDLFTSSVLRPAFAMLAQGLVLISIIIFLILLDPLLSALAAALLGGMYLSIFLLLKGPLARLGLVRVEANKMRYTAASEAFGAIKYIKLLGCEASYLRRFSGPSQRFANSQATYQVIQQVPRFVIEALAFGGIIVLVLGMMIAAGGLSSNPLGEILPLVGVYTFAAYRMQPALNAVFQGFASLRFGRATVDNLCKDLHRDRVISQLPESPPKPIKARREIALRALSYSYPGAAKRTLVDLNFEIPVGSVMGLVGSTGAGKTTLVDILLGLLHPTQGAVCVDGQVVTASNVGAWQQTLGYVPQEIVLNDTTISENIALGVPASFIDHAQVKRCAQIAQVHDFIANELPNKYDTVVGERGVRLSGGQRQRIGIARALYRNPQIIVFDEATSALDPQTERAVMRAITTLPEKRTIILIAHRLSTVKNCDQILLLEGGHIKAKGNYDELVQTSAAFAEMAKPS